MSQRRLALVLLLTVFTVGMTTRLTLAGPRPVDLAIAINQQHHQATGGWLAGDHALNVYAQALAGRLADAPASLPQQHQRAARLPMGCSS